MTNPVPDTSRSPKGSMPLFLLLIVAGLAGNYFKFPLFLNIDFLFGSIFAMLILQFFGLARGLFGAAIIASYTYFIWNHPYAIVIMTAEVAIVGWLIDHRKLKMVVADTLFWLIIGMPLVYLFYHVFMGAATSSTYITMLKQAINGIANALVARLVFSGYALRTRSSLLTYQELVYNALAFFVIFPMLLMLAFDSRTDFNQLDSSIRDSLKQDAVSEESRLNMWVANRMKAVVNLADMAVSIAPHQMQEHLEQATKSDTNFQRIALINKEAISTAYFPTIDELGHRTIGKNYSDRSYIRSLKQNLKPMLSEMAMSTFGTPKPRVAIFAPVIKNGEYNGFIAGVLSLDQISDWLQKNSIQGSRLYTLLDKNGNVITSNRTDQKELQPFKRGQGTLIPVDSTISKWVPALPPRTPASEKWKKSTYVAEISIGNMAEWKLILEQPVAPFQTILFEDFIIKIALMFGILLASLTLSKLFSRKIIATIENLRQITQDLPTQLASSEKKISWPESGIAETSSLIENFKKTADALAILFNEVRQANESLEQRVEERTSELIQKNAQLQESKNALKEAQRVGHMGSWYWDAITDEVWWSDELFRIYGKNPVEALPTYAEDQNNYTPESGALLTSAVNKILQGGESYVVDLELANKGESRRWVQARGEAIKDDSGKVVALRGTVQDISEQKQLELYREVRQKILQLLYLRVPARESINSIVPMLQAEFQFDAVGIRLKEGDDYPYLLAIGFTSDFLEKENSLLARKPDGEVFKDDEGRSCLECICGQVISGEVKQCNHSFTPAGSFWANDTSPLLDMPPDQEPRFHLRKECIHHQFSSIALIPIRVREEIVGLIQLNDRRKNRFTPETLQELESIASHIGEKILRDMVDDSKTRLQEQLLQSQKMEAVGLLAGGVAHDFNNILQVISTYCFLLLRDSNLMENQIMQLNEIKQSAERASQLTRGLLAFSRKQPLKMKSVDLNDIVQRVHKFLARIIGEDITIDTACRGPELPIVADQGQIEQVLINLATNARDAMNGGGVFSVRSELIVLETVTNHDKYDIPPGKYALLTASDTGSGISKEHIDRIFEPFFTTKEVGKGTGLGMAIIYGIIKQHNGFINVSSEPGKGTTFRIYLPIHEENGTAPIPRIDAEPAIGGNETILIAEDDPSVRALLCEVLKSNGYEVIAAEDGNDVIDKYKVNQGRISLILMDMIMPIKSGMEAYREIQTIGPGTKVLFTSGYPADYIENRGASEEGIELIMKPVQPNDLLKKIRDLLDT